MEYNSNFIKIFEQSFRDNFELPALSDYGTDVRFTYGELAAEIKKLHLLFEKQNIKQGDKIALIGKNCACWSIVFVATMTYGAVIVPILPDFNPEDVHHIVNHSESQLLFASDSTLKNLKSTEMHGLQAVYSLNTRSFQQENATEDVYEQLNQQFAALFPNGFKKDDIKYPDISGDKLAILNYTSGTTGFSKGVLITADNMVGNLVFAHNEIELRRGHALVSMLPLAHAYGGAFELLFPLQEGCHVVLLGKTPSPNILLKAFAEVKPNLIIAVPLILEKIYRNMILPLIEKKIVRLLLKIPGINSLLYNIIRKKLVGALGGNFIQVVIGGAPLNKEVEAFLLKIHFPVSVGYGMTECAPLISFSLAQNYLPYSCGKVLPCMEVRIDSPNPFTIAGEIQVKGKNVMQGYFKNEEANRNIFTEDKWLKTGDLGTIDKDNNIYIRGRSKNMILGPSGQNIYPEEIEAKLDNLPYVAESLIVERDRRLVALVYPNFDALKAAGVGEEDIPTVMQKNKELLNARVANYEKISEIQVCKEEFEKTPKKSIKRYLYA